VLRDVRGAVYVEFLLVFMPVFMLFLAVVELGFMYGARLVVQHAATRAARAAVVILDDDPERYDDEPRGQLDLNGSAGGESPIAAFMSGAGLGSGAADAGGGPRFRDIRSAAVIPLLAIAPSARHLELDAAAGSIGSEIGDPADRAAAGAQHYNQAGLAVTFPTAPRASSFRTSFGKEDLVTVRVTYLFHCAVPLVSQIMCDSREGTIGRLEAEERAQMDFGHLSTLANPRFLVLRAEATLRNQGAAYLYPSELP